MKSKKRAGYAGMIFPLVLMMILAVVLGACAANISPVPEGTKGPVPEETPLATDYVSEETAPATEEPGKTPGETEGPSEATKKADDATEKPEEPTEKAGEETEKATEAAETVTPEPEETAAPTPAPTEAPTPTPPVIDPENIDLGRAADYGVLTYFASPKYLSAEVVNDGAEGRVLALKTGSVGSSGTSTPQIFFKYKDFCNSIGLSCATLDLKPFVVLKVKAENYSGKVMSLMCATSTGETETLRQEVFRSVKQGEWQYILFDFSGLSYGKNVTMFRIIPEQFAGGNNETLLISEIKFLTQDEAATFANPDVYEIKASSGSGADIKILQFNIQTENGNSAPVRVKSDMFRQLLDEQMPDIVAMQEVTTTWRKWLDAFVFNDSYAGFGEPRSTGGEANPIYYRKDKFDLLESGTFWLSETPDVAGSSFEKANYPRICTWGRFRDKATGREFVHFNTHLDHNGNNNSTDGNTIRKEQIKVILRFSRRFGDTPIFLTGDLNNRRTTSSGEFYALYKMITGKSKVEDLDGTKFKMKLADSRDGAPVTVDENHASTMVSNYDANGSSYNPAKEPIDYIFYSSETTDARTYETFLINRGSYWISDHLPVLGTFTIR